MNNQHRARPVLNKDEVLKLFANHLSDNKYSSIYNLKSLIERQMTSQGIIGEITEGNSMYRTTFNRRISDEDALLINECIYDLLYTRVITPGNNADNLELPWIHVSDDEKLKELL